MRAKLFISVCASALFAIPTGAGAQEVPDTAVQADDQSAGATDIIVTATRREERIQDVPISISAFTQEDLTQKGIVGYEGIGRETPGVVLNKPTANFNNFTARGIATNGYNANLQSSVAIYIDELPVSTIGNTTVVDPKFVRRRARRVPARPAGDAVRIGLAVGRDAHPAEKSRPQ